MKSLNNSRKTVKTIKMYFSISVWVFNNESVFLYAPTHFRTGLHIDARHTNNRNKVLKILAVLTHILSACNTGCSKTETPNPAHSLWSASSGDH